MGILLFAQLMSEMLPPTTETEAHGQVAFAELVFLPENKEYQTRCAISSLKSASTHRVFKLQRDYKNIKAVNGTMDDHHDPSAGLICSDLFTANPLPAIDATISDNGRMRCRPSRLGQKAEWELRSSVLSQRLCVRRHVMK